MKTVRRVSRERIRRRSLWQSVSYGRPTVRENSRTMEEKEAGVPFSVMMLRLSRAMSSS